MTLQNGIWAINGESMDSVQARLFYRSSTRNNKGIVEIGDLLVTAQSTPNGTVNVGDGAAIIRGAEVLWQGSYWILNEGNSTVTIAPTTGSPRNDLVWLRIEDPTFASSPWIHNPATDVCANFVVTQGVSSGTVEVPGGYSGIPLALITIPASTSAITSGMITDLRYMSDPRTKTLAFAMNAGAGNDYATSQNTYKNWPLGTSYTNVPVPIWAASATINVNVYGAMFQNSGGYGTGATDAQGFLSATLGGSLRTSQTPFYFDAVTYDPGGSGTNHARLVVGTAGQVSIPASMRGTGQTLQTETVGSNNKKGTLNSDNQTVAFMQIIFNEAPVSDYGTRLPY